MNNATEIQITREQVAAHMEKFHAEAKGVMEKIFEAKYGHPVRGNHTPSEISAMLDKRVSKGTRVVNETSSIARPCKQVWHIADSLPGAKRKDVIEACQKAGIAFYTARTQYQQWASIHKAEAAAEAAKASK